MYSYSYFGIIELIRMEANFAWNFLGTLTI